jgi:hypothetical protein
MKITYYHNPGDDYSWIECPPTLDCSEKEEKILTKFWHLWNGKGAYIVDPLGHKQCLYIMLLEIPFGKIIRKLIPSEHKWWNGKSYT